jgi:hypothetical protein
MYLARQIDGGPVQLWEIDDLEICRMKRNHEPIVRKRQPRVFRFGEPVIHGKMEWPMLCKRGTAAVGNTVEEAMRLLHGGA